MKLNKLPDNMGLKKCYQSCLFKKSQNFQDYQLPDNMWLKKCYQSCLFKNGKIFKKHQNFKEFQKNAKMLKRDCFLVTSRVSDQTLKMRCSKALQGTVRSVKSAGALCFYAIPRVKKCLIKKMHL